MLIAHGILPDLISQLSNYSTFGIAPIVWDQDEGQFKVKKCALTCIGSVITFQLGICLLLYDLYREYLLYINGGALNGESPILERAYSRIQRLSCALLLIFVALIHGSNMRRAHILAAFFNGIIAFEQKYTGRLRLPSCWRGKLTKYFCLLTRLSNCIGPLLISVLITVSEPSSPLNLIGFLTSNDANSFGEMADNVGGAGGSTGNGGGSSGNSDVASAVISSGITILTGNQLVQRFITGTITAILNIIIWYMTVNIRGFWTCGQILIGCYGIHSALNLYASIMTRGKLIRITKEKVQEALIYREIQLLSTLFNEVHGHCIFVIFLLVSSLLQTVSLYLYVRLMTTTMTNPFYFVPISWTWTSSRLFLAYMVFDGILVIFIVFGCCAEVYITSVKVKAQLQGNDVFQRSEWFTQFFFSCPTIKFKGGSTSFGAEGEFGCGNGGEGEAIGKNNSGGMASSMGEILSESFGSFVSPITNNSRCASNSSLYSGGGGKSEQETEASITLMKARSAILDNL